MSLNLTLTYDDLGVRAAADGLRDMGANLRTELFVPIGAALESTTIERFDTGVSPDGEAWVPSLRAKLTGGKTLQDKGHLRDSFHYEAEDGAVEIGSAHISAAAHQFGATITGPNGLAFKLADGGFRKMASVTLPARPMVGLSVEDGAIVIDLGEAALARAVAGRVQ